MCPAFLLDIFFSEKFASLQKLNRIISREWQVKFYSVDFWKQVWFCFEENRKGGMYVPGEIQIPRLKFF